MDIRAERPSEEGQVSRRLRPSYSPTFREGWSVVERLNMRIICSPKSGFSLAVRPLMVGL
jgi:hypothetical protein